jgi:hypothetical protein
MPKHGKRRVYRPARSRRPEDNGQSAQRLQAEARARASARTRDELQDDLTACLMRQAEADQQAQMDPSPASLALFRATSNERRILEAALAL